MKHYRVLIAILILASYTCLCYGLMEATNKLRMGFIQHINPTKNQDGIVVLGIQAVDQLNIKYGCNDYYLVDDHSSTYLKELITFIYPSDVVNDALVQDYRGQCNGLYDFLCPQQKPEVLETPGDYLFSQDLNHTQDVLGRIYSDNDDKRYWMVYNTFNYEVVGTNNWGLNPTNWPQLVDCSSFSNLSYNDIPPMDWGGQYAGTGGPFVYGSGHQFHGNIGLWQHTSEYNDVLNAWNYTMGENNNGDPNIVIICDFNGFKTDHPDLAGQFVDLGPDYSTSYHLSGNLGRNVHGTKCAGALAAKIENNSQNGVFNTSSSAGISPKVMIVGLDDISQFDALKLYMQQVGVYNRVKVFSCSIPGLESGYREFREMISDGIIPVIARGYGSIETLTQYGGDFVINNQGDVINYVDDPGMLVVGDYMPNYRVKNRYEIAGTDYNVMSEFKSNISAPGLIWVPGYVYATTRPGFTESHYDDPTLDFGSNTSIATPQVAGVAALIYSMYPWMTPDQVKNQIMSTGHHLYDMYDASQDFLPLTPLSYYGAGAVDAYGALFLHGTFLHNDISSNDGPGHAVLAGNDFALNFSDFTIADGDTLRVQKDANVLFCDCNVTFADNSTIVLEDNAVMTFDSDSHVTFGSNVTIKSQNSSKPGNIYFNNQDFTLSHGSILRCNLNIVASYYEISSSSIRTATINTKDCGNIITGCDIDSSMVIAHFGSPVQTETEGVTYTNNDVLDTYEYPNSGIYVENSNRSDINGNMFSRQKIAIDLWYSNARICDNDISLSEVAGISIYASKAEIRGSNNVYNNTVGFVGDGYIAPTVMGSTTQPFQKFINNDQYQLLFDYKSAPSLCNWNYIYYDHHPDDVRVMCVHPPVPITTQLDFRHNYWTNDFNPHLQLSPSALYNYTPVWNGSKDSPDSLSAIFLSALDDESNGDYLSAKDKYLSLLNADSPSNLFNGSIVNLYYLTALIDNDYAGLENTLNGLTQIGTNDTLFVQYYKNLSHLPQQEYVQAINTCEDIISNPPSEADSLYAVMDASYAYYLMQQSGEKHTGKYPWLNVKDRKALYELQSRMLEYATTGVFVYPEDGSISTLVGEG